MQRALVSLPLCDSHQRKLLSAGFETVKDFNDVGVVELSKEADLSHSEALEILRVVNEAKADSLRLLPNESLPSGTGQASTLTTLSGKVAGNGEICGKSALELLQCEQELGNIVTFSSQVDSILGGGVPLRKITEICGAPGVGKTQFSMQLAVDVRIPEIFGGVGGEAIYIDTEGSFVVERVADLAQAAVNHIINVAKSKLAEKELIAAASSFTLETVLSGVHYYRCHNYIELVALVNVLPEILSQNSKNNLEIPPKVFIPQLVRLIVIDSIASPFRYGFQDMGLRNRILSGLSQTLIRLAVTNNIAVVLTNQMTTKFHVNQTANTTSELVPALGESWGHACTVRVILLWRDGQRYAKLCKSPNRKLETAHYQITQDGIRDVILEADSSPDLGLSQCESISRSQLEELENLSDDFDNYEETPFSNSPPLDECSETHDPQLHVDLLQTGQLTDFQSSLSNLLDQGPGRPLKREYPRQDENEFDDLFTNVFSPPRKKQ